MSEPRVESLLGTWRIRPDGKIEVKTHYADVVAARCRKLGGKWEGGAWVLAGTRLAEVKEELGDPSSGLVEVEVGKDEMSEKGAQYLVGWYVLCGRRGRDSRADLYADLVAGEIPDSGGSTKYPLVAASDDARFRLVVPKDFVEARNLPVVRGVGVVSPEGTTVVPVKPGSPDWNLLEEMVRRLGPAAVTDAVTRMTEQP